MTSKLKCHSDPQTAALQAFRGKHLDRHARSRAIAIKHLAAARLISHIVQRERSVASRRESRQRVQIYYPGCCSRAWIASDTGESTMSQDPVVIVTTSWDDGHSTDLRVAELLAAHGLKATFYIAFNHPNTKEIGDDEIRMLHRAGMEIGSHTMSHRLLTGRPAAEVNYELKESRMRLEDIVGAPVTAFSYPQGAFTAVARAAAAETGYRLGRSTMAFRTAYDFDPLLMPISLEFCRYSRLAITRHALRDVNLTGLTNWARIAKLETDPLCLGRLMFDEVSLRGGIFHLNARSWEIDKNELWDQLAQTVRHIAEHPAIHSATNSEVLLFYN